MRGPLCSAGIALKMSVRWRNLFAVRAFSFSLSSAAGCRREPRDRRNAWRETIRNGTLWGAEITAEAVSIYRHPYACGKIASRYAGLEPGQNAEMKMITEDT